LCKWYAKLNNVDVYKLLCSDYTNTNFDANLLLLVVGKSLLHRELLLDDSTIAANLTSSTVSALDLPEPSKAQYGLKTLLLVSKTYINFFIQPHVCVHDKSELVLPMVAIQFTCW
jgi:hypothetical protein